MQDFKQYLPHHREQQEPQLLDKANKLLVLAMMVGIIGLMVFTFWQGLYQEAELAHAVAESRKKERQRIVTLVAKDIEDSRRYEAYLDRLIAKEYRGQ